MIYDPENWLESTLAALKEYTHDRLNEIEGVETNDIYEIVMDFPGASLDARRQEVPLDKSIIHFALDDLIERSLGMGDSVIANNYSAADQANFAQEAGIVTMDFDVGIWTSDRSGGTSVRTHLRHALSQIFHGATAMKRFREQTSGADGGVEIRSFTGGRFSTEKIGDVLVYRTINSTLVIRVFSRTPKPTSGEPTIESVSQSPGLTILG